MRPLCHKAGFGPALATVARHCSLVLLIPSRQTKVFCDLFLFKRKLKCKEVRDTHNTFIVEAGFTFESQMCSCITYIVKK